MVGRKFPGSKGFGDFLLPWQITKSLHFELVKSVWLEYTRYRDLMRRKYPDL